MDIGTKIRNLRISKGMTQEKLAEATDLSTRTVQRIENGEVDPRANSLQLIAKALDVEYGYFIEEAEDEGRERSERDRLWLAVMHLSLALLLFLPTVILWQLKKKAIKGISSQLRDLLIVQLYCWLFVVIPGVLIYWKMDKPGYLIIGLSMTLIWAIHNAVMVARGKALQLFPVKKNEKETNCAGKS